MSRFLPGTIRYGREDFPDLLPFSLRSALSYEDILSAMRVYLRDVVNPYIEEDSAKAVWDANAAALTTAVDARVDEAILALADATVPVTDAVIAAVLNAGTSTTEGLLDGRYQRIPTAFGHRLLTGAGIDLTGATPSNAGVQAFLDACVDGDTVTVPSGAVIALQAGVTVGKRIRFTGTGELRYTGTAEGSLVTVTADGAHVDALRLTNPGGAPVGGIEIRANAVLVTGNRVIGMRDGILVAATGEFHDPIIVGNHVLDVIGSGTGNTTGDWSSGESNGDGIVSWGATGIVVGNRVTAKAGRDARIGIHMENLSGREVLPYEDADSVGVISGNVVSGPFRRAITTEGVQHVAITGNTISGPTFWGINIVGLAHHSVVTGNTIKWKSTNTVAGYIRAGVFVYCIQESLTGVTIQGNTIHALAGSHIDHGIVINYDASVASGTCRRIKIHANTVEDDSNTLGDGIHITGPSDAVEVTENRIYRFGGNGVYLQQGTRATVANNRLYGRGTAPGANGVNLDGGAAEATIDNNTVRDVETGIRAYFRTETLSVQNNKIRNASYGVNCFGATAPLTLLSSLNLFYQVANPWNAMPAGTGFTTVSVGNSA